jgi:hypothetical protein
VRAEQFVLALRPRPTWEAVDLGVRMTQAAGPSLVRAYLPFAALLAAACLATIELRPWLPILLMWWFKPWLERGLLFVYARQAFGEPTTFAQAWAARAAAPWGPVIAALTWRRLLPWRAFIAPIVQLEGQQGAARKRRIAQLANGQRGAALMAQMVFSWIEGFLALGLLSGIALLTPGLDWVGFGRLLRGDDGVIAIAGLLSVCSAVALVFVAPFHAAGGFAMYLNRRADLEAWDVEQDLREAFAGAPA